MQHHHAIGWEIQAVGKQLAVGFKQFNKRRKQAKEIRSHGKVDRQKTALETRGLAIANYNYAVEKLRDYS
ncbi:hypothetical protein FACS1894104_5450 [Actinomycetota bacterium]|nr:hypothetical protein FACS1894104_5450 [Actinomycetota bacterium]